MDSMNHYDNPMNAFDENQHRHVWSEHITVPSSLLSHVLEQVELGRDGQTRVDELVAALHHPEWSMRVAAVQALVRLGEHAPLEQLQKALYDEHVSVRASAVSAIGQLRADVSMPLLEQALHDSEWQVREKAVLALAMLGTQSSIRLLYEALYDPDSTVREAVSYGLQQIQASAPLAGEEVASVERQRFSRVTIPANEDSLGYSVLKSGRRRGKHVFTTSIALFAVLALVIIWIILTPLQHLSTTTIDDHHTGSIGTMRPTIMALPLPIPAVPHNPER